MSKNKISDYDSTAANNTDVGGINIQGGAPPSNFDNALREFASHLADMNAGTSPIDDTFTLADPADNTKRVRIDAGTISTGETRTLTMPDENIVLKNLDAADNVSDADKPVSTAQAAAIDAAISYNSPSVILEDQKSSGTNGGTFTAGAWQVRDLNTETLDPNGLATLASNAFTFSKSGYVRWVCPAVSVNVHQTRLYNVTDSAVVAIGSTGYANASNFGFGLSVGSGLVVAGKQYRLEHRCYTTSSASGYGYGGGFGNNEIFSRLEYWRDEE